MDQIYAKVKRLRASPLRRIVSNEKLFDSAPVNSNNRIPYSSETLLAEDEWFSVGEFSEKEFFPVFFREDFASSDISELEKAQFENISYLISVQDGDYFFQRVVPSSMLRRKVLAFGDVAYIEKPLSRIVVNPQPDAIFIRESDELIFRDLARISPIFPGIDTLFQEATAEQVQEFLSQDFISTKDFEVSDVSKPNRKRIALALDSLGKMSPQERGDIFSYIREYCEGKLLFDAQNSTFTIASDEDVKNMVYGIEERFYTTTVRGEKRLANSIIRL